jgi:tape measure domain-containing protein
VADSLGSAVLTLSVDDSAYKAGLNAARQQTTSAVDGIAASFRNLAGIVGVIGIGAFTQQVIAAGQESQKTKLQLEALTAAYGEQSQAAASIARIQAVLGISASQAREGYSQLYAALRGTGIGAEQLEVLFVGLTKAAIASGASSAEASAGLLQLKQGLAAGSLQGDELRSVLESIPALSQAIAQQLGVNVGQLKQLGADGKITSDVLFAAAKQFAGQTVRAKTETENLSVAFEKLKEQIAAAVGPGIREAFAGIAAGIATFAKLVDENSGKIQGFVVGTLALGKALAPFAAAILTVRAAMAAYQVAAKAAAVAQAAVLALSGPKGWAILATGLGLAAGAAYGIEKAMEGVGTETEKAKKEYERYKKEFEGVLAGTSLDPPSAEKTQKEIDKIAKSRLKAEEDILRPSKERLSDLQATLGLEGAVLEVAKQQLAVDKARIEEAKAIAAYDKALSASGFNREDPAVIEAAARLQAAGLNVRSALIEGGQQAASLLNQSTQDLKSALDAQRSAREGAFDLLTNGLQQQLLQDARRRIQAGVNAGELDPRKVNAAARTPQDILRIAGQADSLVNAQNAVAKAATDLRVAIEGLNGKDWAVNVKVNADGTYQAYGDTVNNAVGAVG